jgi:hypothetical protein
MVQRHLVELTRYWFTTCLNLASQRKKHSRTDLFQFIKSNDADGNKNKKRMPDLYNKQNPEQGLDSDDGDNNQMSQLLRFERIRKGRALLPKLWTCIEKRI